MSTAVQKHRRHSAPPTGLRRIVVPVVLILLGVLVLLYPVVSTQYNNVRQQFVVKEYERLANDVPAKKKEDLFATARDYNAAHESGPVLDPWLARISLDNAEYQKYLHVLGNGDVVPMSQIVVPSAKVNLPVYHGSDDYILQHGVGHLFGSSMPIGGDNTHAVLTGHTGLTNATLFDNLTKVKKGDAIYINTYGRHMKYEVTQIKVVLPEETKDLAVVPGEDLVTLVTCTPYGINTHRLLVTGTRVPMDPQEEAKIVSKTSGLTWQWWMLACMGAALLILLLLSWWVIKTIHEDRKRRKNLHGSIEA